MERYSDVIVVGCGAMGSGAVRCLAEKGLKVLGIDQSEPPHNLGSSHGETRITRLAIGEGHFYSPFAIRSHQIWRDLENRTGLRLLYSVGGVIISDTSHSMLHGSKDFLGETEFAAKTHRIKYERLNNKDLRDRFPQFNFSGNEEGYYEPTAGFIMPEKCISAQLYIARRNRARILTNTKVTNVVPFHDKVIVQTSVGTFTAGKVIISAGAWVKKILGSKFDSIFQIHRQVLYWFNIRNVYSQFTSDRGFPVFIWNGRNFIYGFPAINGPDAGLKVGSESINEVDPDKIERHVSFSEINEMYVKTSTILPNIGSDCIKAAVCMYTETADRHFVIDYHPESENIIIASPCSGHGFKHSAAIGEALSEMAVSGRTALDISHFGLSRFKV